MDGVNRLFLSTLNRHYIRNLDLFHINPKRTDEIDGLLADHLELSNNEVGLTIGGRATTPYSSIDIIT